MKNILCLVLLFQLAPIRIIGQTQEATTSDGKKIIVNVDGTWKYAQEAITSDGKKVILNTDGTWKYSEKNDSSKAIPGVSYKLEGRSFKRLAAPKYKYQGEGKVVVDVTVDRLGKVILATPGTKGSTTLDSFLLELAKEAAISTTFDAKPNAPEVQKGTITYIFMLK